MAVKFLTDEWAKAITDTLNENEEFRNAIANTELTLQYVVTDAPDGGEIHFYTKFDKGNAEQGMGDVDNPDVTITGSYDTMAGIFKGEVNTQTAFMTGKIKVSGNLAKIMMNQAVLQRYADAISGLEVEY